MFTHHLSTIAPVKSSFRRHFHAGDHSRDGKSFPCATAGQGKTTASNGLGLVFLLYFSIPFDAPTKQHDPREYKWKFDNSLCFSFFLPLFFSASSYLSVKRLCRAHWHSPPRPSLLLLLIALVWKKALSCSLIHLTPLRRALTSDLW